MTNKDIPLIPVILSGGIGSRLWPLSRESFPKQFWNLSEKNKFTLLQNSYLRLKDIRNKMDPIVICNKEHRFIIANQLDEIQANASSIILEPEGRNTAPAIAIAALEAMQKHTDPLLLVISSDHEIKDVEKFTSIIEQAKSYAQDNKLVVFGVPPTQAETGYGYIKSKKELNSSIIEGVEIEKFIEKPDIRTANILFKDKHFSWNSGIFLFKAKLIIDELTKYNEELINHCKLAYQNSINDLDFKRINSDYFLKCINISIDVAVMERTNLGIVIPLDVGWSDIGTWDSIWDIAKKDNNGNAKKGKIFGKKIKNCYIRSDKKLILAIGISDLIIVEQGDSILISKKKESQSIKTIIEELNKKNLKEVKSHNKVFRPWGSYTTLREGERWLVKKITVKPKASLSLQMHKHRSEHWVVVQGQVLVEINNEKKLLNEDESIFIPLGCKHRLSNPTNNETEIIEVQTGNYLSEEDIIRFEDFYGRDNNIS